VVGGVAFEEVRSGKPQGVQVIARQEEAHLMKKRVPPKQSVGERKYY
jgi:hypothetical protein